MSSNKKLRKQPTLESDDAAERFVAEADLSEYDLSGFKPTHFEFQRKDTQINMRLPRSLLEAVKQQAARQNIPYQRYIRNLLERAIHNNNNPD